MKTAVMMLCAVLSLHAQVEIFGLRTYANNDEYRPPVIARGEQVTIEFDVATSLPPNLHILFSHASKEWVKDDNIFVNEPSKNRAEVLIFSSAAAGVQQYRYRYRNSFPNTRNIVTFPYSGNYLYTIVDHDAADRAIAAGRFIVAESSVPVSVTVENKYHSEYASPFNQMNFISVDVALPAEFTAADMDGINFHDVKEVRVIRNWELDRMFRIAQDDTDPETFVENFTRPNKTFWKRDFSPGNEYRRLDLSSASYYPNSRLAVIRGGPDVSRFQWQGSPDANGASKLNAFTGANSEYLEVELRLRLAQDPGKQIFAAGGFTNWNVLPEYELKQDTAGGLYTVRFWTRRGVYDYQYVLGNIGPQGTVSDQDWVTLEGNDWRTINRYIALVYYRDPRFGGYDRVIGFARVRNPGTSEPGRKISGMNPMPDSVVKPTNEERTTRKK